MLVMGQETCADNKFLLPCDQFECDRVCILNHGEAITSWGTCTFPFICRCHYTCSRQAKSQPDHTASTYPSINP